MGNCLERNSHKLQEEKKEEALKKEEKSYEGAVKVRVVLTKPELEWLMLQLEKQPGQMSLEALLAQILEETQWKEEEKWKPALESIMEVPEVQSIENSPETEPQPLPISLIS